MESKLLLGDCLIKLKDIEDNSIDSIVTDPPYHLTSIVKRFGKDGSAPAKYGTDGVFQRSSKGFMGQEWDGGDIAFRTEVWEQCLRVLKPGGHMLAFSSPRTYHRMACAIEDAGFEIRDQIMWVYGSGFPKSHNLKDEWESWGTALKPAHEPIVMARKPLSEKTISSNVKKHSTGAINIDGCRVGTDEISVHNAPKGTFAGGELDRGSDTNSYKIHIGRWPANFIHDGSEEVVENFPETAPSKSGIRRNKSGMGIHDSEKGTFGKGDVFGGYDDSGSAARFFYCPKASKQDRNEGVNIWDVEDLKLELIDINQLIKDISEDYLMEKCEWNTIMSMNNIMDQSKKDLIFIISMVSKLITDLKTYNVSQNLNIKEYIQDVSKQFQENGLNLVENAEQIKILKQNTTGEKMELVLGVSLVVLKMLLKIKEIENRTSGHPTVKPTDLMKYLCRLITPKNGTILDPFMGSGSTGKAALLQGFSFVGIERDEEYFKIAEKRIKNVNS